MIPVVLIVGFLGAGKTTLMKQVHRRYADRHLVYLVNEFSEVDVDGPLLASEIGNLISLPGGSIFCKCLSTEFLRVLSMIPGKFASEHSIEGLVIEASGIANPVSVLQMFKETGMNRQYEMNTILSVVDPGSFLKLIQVLPNIEDQVASSNLVVINKVDLYSQEEIQEVETTVLKINPKLEIIKTTYCQFDRDLFETQPPPNMEGPMAVCADPNFARLSVRVPNNLDLSRFLNDLEEIRKDAHRIKGFLSHQDKVHYLDVSASGISIKETPESCPPLELAFIFPGNHQSPCLKMVQNLMNGVYDLPATGPES